MLMERNDGQDVQIGEPTGKTAYCKKCGKDVDVVILDKRAATGGILVPHECCAQCQERLD